MITLNIKEASRLATEFTRRNISTSNISYLVQYGKIRKNDQGLLLKDDLINYYKKWKAEREISWKDKLGNDLNWKLSFDNLTEKDTTKHVHRLHPYKGKYIPQLVEYFLNDKIDEFKKEIYFKKGDIILDPFVGSGTTIIQSLEMGYYPIGIDISDFNSMISNCKAEDYDIEYLNKIISKIIKDVEKYETNIKVSNFEEELNKELNIFNGKYFYGADFKYEIEQKKIDEKKYSQEKEKEFLIIYKSLLKKHNIKIKQEKQDTFLDIWFINSIRIEIDYIFSKIKLEKDKKYKKILALILSRAIRSCRATTHSDLATLKEPQFMIYYCFKHKKICKPIFSIKDMFIKYAKDTILRIKEFKNNKKHNIFQIIPGDSRRVNIEKILEKNNIKLFELYKKKKISGIFCSPPYVGQIDYHEQHAYSYDLFGFKRKDELEIGPMFRGQSIKAKEGYVKGISDVLNNCKKFFKKDYNVFLVANDKHNLYTKIADLAGMKIVNQFKRPVLNRTERDKNPYSEIIFHLKEK